MHVSLLFQDFNLKRLKSGLFPNIQNYSEYHTIYMYMKVLFYQAQKER